MSCTDLLNTLSVLGVRLVARGGRVVARGPAGVMTPQLREELARQKPQLLAILTGKPQPSDVAGIAWDARGGVRLAQPPSIRSVCLAEAERRAFPKMPSAQPCMSVAAGREAWTSFTANASLADVIDVALAIDMMPVASGRDK